MPRTGSTKDCKLAKQDTRQALIDAGSAIIQEKGFNNTGIEQILKCVGVPKGSFYYYFKSKDDFGLSIIDYHADLLKQCLKATFVDSPLPPMERLRQYFQAGRDILERNECRKGCLFGNLSQEMADQNETFRVRLAEVFTEWCHTIAGCLKEAQEQGDIPAHMCPERLAEYLMFSWEGAVMRCKINKSVQPMDIYDHFVFNELLKPS